MAQPHFWRAIMGSSIMYLGSELQGEDCPSLVSLGDVRPNPSPQANTLIVRIGCIVLLSEIDNIGIILLKIDKLVQ
jgi:hypothetical protein